MIFLIFHDSQDLFYRNPFGAVPCGQNIIIRLKADTKIKVQSAMLRKWTDENGEEKFNMECMNGNSKIFEVNIKAPDEPCVLWYYFIIHVSDRIYYYGNNSMHQGGAGEVYGHEPDSYQITVYKRRFYTPGWFKDGVMYHIFVDRFCNGNRNGEILNKKEGRIIHKNWSEIPYAAGEKNLNNDFFGGNLLGIIKKLPYLKELGIDVIYLSPIFESPSNHKYDTGDYMKIDPMFGDNRTFKMLCEKAKDLGISVILDGVFSHTGSDSVYFNKFGHYDSKGAYQSKDSPYYPWYNFIEYPEKYECWWGIDSLPNVNELEKSYQDFILFNRDSVVRYWMHLGCRGWRLDVADELPDGFLKNMRTVVKGEDQDAVIIGEVWDDASNKISYGKMKEYLLGDELDSATNYPLRFAVIKFFMNEWDALQLHKCIMSIYENYPKCVFYSMMNFLGSHDTVRIRTVFGEARCEDVSKKDAGSVKLSLDQKILSLRRLKAAALFQMAFPGVPCIYYGDEVGVEGCGDPFSRGTYPWKDGDMELYKWYRNIISVRHRVSALRTGYFIPVYHSGSVYGFIRTIKNGKDIFGQKRENGFAVIIFNSSIRDKKQVNIDMNKWGIEKLHDVLHDNKEIRTNGGHLSVSLNPIEGKLLIGS
ncbi:MAG: glycoside hydrolase family 13 protein [Clostridiales bacterium]|nr:glycoside hydrolase family 13 protein [Clostridiales bacterium]